MKQSRPLCALPKSSSRAFPNRAMTRDVMMTMSVARGSPAILRKFAYLHPKMATATNAPKNSVGFRNLAMDSAFPTPCRGNAMDLLRVIPCRLHAQTARFQELVMGVGPACVFLSPPAPQQRVQRFKTKRCACNATTATLCTRDWTVSAHQRAVIAALGFSTAASPQDLEHQSILPRLP